MTSMPKRPDFRFEYQPTYGVPVSESTATCDQYAQQPRLKPASTSPVRSVSSLARSSSLGSSPSVRLKWTPNVWKAVPSLANAALESSVEYAYWLFEIGMSAVHDTPSSVERRA